MTEWRVIPGFDKYEVSDEGQIRRGRRLLTPQPNGLYMKVGLYDTTGARRSLRVHKLVLTAFRGPRPDGLEARHLNGDGHDNALTNLCWGTSSQNKFDQVRHGTHPKATATRCPSGHEYTQTNTYRFSDGRRYCRECHLARKQFDRKPSDRLDIKEMK